MRHSLPQGALCAALLTPLFIPSAALASDPEIAELRATLNQLKNQYERRIADLESRLAHAERAGPRKAKGAGSGSDPAVSRPMTAPSAEPVAASPAARSGGVLGALSSGSAFNPQIAVILDGNYYHDGIGGAGSALVGAAYQPSQLAPHTHTEEAAGAHEAHSHGAAENGFNFREAELSFTATVDPYFDAALFLAIDGDGTVELEEGWLQTRALPYGLRMKAGKFLSDFGYINKQHPHQWDFVDQNLPYLNLLGAHGLQDTGVQLTWLAPLPFYNLLGAELAQGDQERFGAVADADQRALLTGNAGDLGEENEGPRLWTAFAKVAPDLPQRHALQFGASYARNNQHQEVQSHTHPAPADDADEADAHSD
ncbi:MAG TPA: porin, partial [Lamprocystis sp. (in: g-proteobacteria)]|nr:porin [Lamprocystis sp. (in: g-proteobacteria)]